MLAFLMMPGKLATPEILKIKLFLNNGSDVRISVDDMTDKILSTYSNNIVYLLMLLKFGKVW